jgi:hypothetical protein
VDAAAQAWRQARSQQQGAAAVAAQQQQQQQQQAEQQQASSAAPAKPGTAAAAAMGRSADPLARAAAADYPVPPLDPLAKAAERLAAAATPLYSRLWVPLSQQPGGIKFLSDMRADLLQAGRGQERWGGGVGRSDRRRLSLLPPLFPAALRWIQTSPALCVPTSPLTSPRRRSRSSRRGRRRCARWPTRCAPSWQSGSASACCSCAASPGRATARRCWKR